MEALQVAAALPQPLVVALLRPPLAAPARARRLQPLRTRRRRRRQRGYLEPTCTLTRPTQTREEQEDRIRERLLAAGDPPPSSYDTAWVAMVPAAAGAGAPGTPRFPRYVEWIMESQHDDGSWGLAGGRLLPRLGKDAVSSTLACVLALKTWSVGDEHVRKGLHFIGRSLSCVTDDKCEAPDGFNVIFPGMVRAGIALGLELPLGQSDVDHIFRLREMELQRMDSGKEAYMAYTAEGLGDIIQDWDQVRAYQSKNGSLFNSPSATSALAIHSRDTNALKYLDLLGNKFHSSVPTMHPMSIYSQLCMVDTLENMGISYRFSSEIKSILDMAYRYWQQNDEKIITDMETCSMAFRILRMHGYQISSVDVFSHFAEESRFHGSVQGHLNDTKALLELYKASQICMYEDEGTLENIGTWTRKVLKQQLSSNKVSRRIMPKEVEYALQIPFYSAAVEPLEHKRNIEHFSIKCIQMRKSAYLTCQAADDILALAIEEFHSSQSLYRQEVKRIESWFREVGLDQLKFARKSPLFIWIFMASIAFPSELSDARIASVQNTLLTVAVDDFFDGGGSAEEQKNLVALIEKWEEHEQIGFCSEHVQILFHAVYSTMSEINAKALKVQNRSVIDRIAQIWIDYLRSNVVEAEWTSKGHVPTMEEYKPVAEVSSAIGPILAVPLFLAGTELSEDMVSDPDPEYKEMLKHTSLCTRFLNDLGTYQKESSQGYVNAVLLHAHRNVHGGSTSMETAEEEVRNAVVVSRRELLRLVQEGSAVPRPCRELFWNMCKVAHLFYLQGDGFLSLQELMAAASEAVDEPLQVKLP
ncbi:unnamed protein product [Urochloa decumbens]|uniref:Uncharacterized protein n=1 Tax=Urochloa decumbens TaxID=240449 RepID=A0ABC9CKM2_9POAL